MIAAVTHGPSVLWYVTRGAGATTLVLLTASVVLGIGEVRMWRPVAAPRFAVPALHRTLSLLALAFLAVHIVTTLLDPFPHIGVVNALVPFATSYRPLWMAFGTLASDLLVALAITSLVRRRLGYRAWRALHWLAYACWPVALLHGLGTGSDVKATWMLALTLGSVVVVVLAVASRLAAVGTPRAVRTAGAATIAASGIALAVWLPAGPLASGWARRAGTPASVLAAFAPPPAIAVVRPVPADGFSQRFSATVSGQVVSGVSAGGTGVVELQMRLRQGPSGVLAIRLGGSPLADGGLLMRSSSVRLGPRSDPWRYRGRVDYLQGSQLGALVGSADGRVVRLAVELSIGQNAVTGQVRGRPVRGVGA